MLKNEWTWIAGALLGLLAMAAVAFLGIGGHRRTESKEDTVRNLDLPAIKQALDTYYAKKGRYPDTGPGLAALVDARIVDRVPTDPWAREYLYQWDDSGRIRVASLGQDGRPGGVGPDADLEIWVGDPNFRSGD